MNIAVLLYEKMTALDAIGPYEVLSRLPGARVQFLAEKSGPVTTDTGFLKLMAESAISDVTEADILVVPGGPGDEAVRKNEKTLAWIRDIARFLHWLKAGPPRREGVPATGGCSGAPSPTSYGPAVPRQCAAARCS